MRQNKLIAELCADPRTYIESVGKNDKQTVIEALRDGGESTVLRLCVALPSSEIPLRSLGYVASALAVQELYLPKAQLQIVHPIRAAERANGTSRATAEKAALRFRTAGQVLFTRHNVGRYQGRLTYLFDRPLRPEDDLKHKVAEVISGSKLETQFIPAAQRRGGDMADYVASHLRVHDTSGCLELEPVDGDFYQDPQPAERVVSVGAQSERPFYAARMMCRRAGVLVADSDMLTGQLFTKHVLPPYQACRQGEPELFKMYEKPYDPFLPSDVPISHEVPSVSRDLIYLQSEMVRQQSRPDFDPSYFMLRVLMRERSS